MTSSRYYRVLSFSYKRFKMNCYVNSTDNAVKFSQLHQKWCLFLGESWGNPGGILWISWDKSWETPGRIQFQKRFFYLLCKERKVLQKYALVNIIFVKFEHYPFNHCERTTCMALFPPPSQRNFNRMKVSSSVRSKVFQISLNPL